MDKANTTFMFHNLSSETEHEIYLFSLIVLPESSILCSSPAYDKIFTLEQQALEPG